MRMLMRPLFTIFILILIFTQAHAETLSPLAPFPFEAPFTKQFQKQQFQLQEALSKANMLATMQMENPSRTANMDLYDVTYYSLELEPVYDEYTLYGDITVKARVLDAPIETLELHLQDNMEAWNAHSGGHPTLVTHLENIITIYLDRTYEPGEMVTISLSYEGNPDFSYFRWDFYAFEDWIWTMSEPYGASYWWPCKNMNSDKPDSLDMKITVPEHLIAASNGTLVSETVPSPGKKTYHWQERHAIAPYLVSLAIYPYTVLNYTYTALDGTTTMPVDFYIVPQFLEQALALYPSTVDMIEAFAQGFGEYPFLDEKYGHAHYRGSSGMEHQTLSSFNINYYMEWLQSHELSHQWFGNYVTCDDFHHIWLNEGFATWCEAYWREINEGMDAYHSEMGFAAYHGPGTIFVEDATDFQAIFDYSLSYKKASWVVHMLRGQLGDETFFAGVRAYLDTYAHSSATTEQFRDVMAEVSGRNLDDFFQRWIYGEGTPDYLISWSSSAVGDDTQVSLRVEQTQSEPEFHLQLPILIQTTEGEQLFTVENDQRIQNFDFLVPGQLEDLQLDPDHWILCFISYDVSDVPNLAGSEPRLLPNVPNPFNPSTTIRYALPDDASVQVAVYDVSGALVRLLESGQRQAGEHSVRWDGHNEQGLAAASGVYFVQLKAGKNTAVRKVTLVQ